MLFNYAIPVMKLNLLPRKRENKVSIVDEAEAAIARLQEEVRKQIELNKIEDANRNKPDLARLKALGMID